MHIEISHEFDIPLDAVELAVVSPVFLGALTRTLGNIERSEQKQHVIKDGILSRVWFFQWNIPIPPFAAGHITKDMCAWDEHTEYDLKRHSGTWRVTPNVKPEWQRYFSAAGEYTLEANSKDRTIRKVTGDIRLNLPIVGGVAERFIAREVRKNFELEAKTLREFATLA